MKREHRSPSYTTRFSEVVAVMALACIFISGILRGNSSPTTGEGWIEAIKKTRR